MIHSFFKKLASSLGAPQENDATFRFAMHPQGIRQFHDNCKVPDCCPIGAIDLYKYNIELYNNKKTNFTVSAYCLYFIVLCLINSKEWLCH